MLKENTLWDQIDYISFKKVYIFLYVVCQLMFNYIILYINKYILI